jgi:transcriptional regulator with XRE-family HTH domain
MSETERLIFLPLACADCGEINDVGAKYDEWVDPDTNLVQACWVWTCPVCGARHKSMDAGFHTVALEIGTRRYQLKVDANEAEDPGHQRFIERLEKAKDDNEKRQWIIFGRWLELCREAARLNIKQAAERVNMSDKQWGRWEKGQSGIEPETLVKVVRAVDASLNKAFSLTGLPMPAGVDKGNTLVAFLRRVKELIHEPNDDLFIIKILIARQQYFLSSAEYNYQRPSAAPSAPKAIRLLKDALDAMPDDPLQRARIWSESVKARLKPRKRYTFVEEFVKGALDHDQHLDLAEGLIRYFLDSEQLERLRRTIAEEMARKKTGDDTA